MKIRLQLVIISIFFSVIFVPAYAVGGDTDSILFTKVEVLPSPIPDPIPDPIPTYTFSQCNDIVVRGKIPTDEVTPVNLEIVEKLTGEINPIGSTVHTMDTNSKDSRYVFDISLSEFLSKDTPAGKYLAVIIYEGSMGPEIKTFEFKPKDSCSVLPDWIKNNAKWWADGSIDDDSFIQGIQFLIKEDILKIPPTTQSSSSDSNEIPSWIKNNAKWWADGSIDDDSFIQGIQFLIKEGIMQV